MEILFYFRYFELQSSTHKNELRLHYTHEGGVFVETFSYQLADGNWHRLAVSFSGNQVSVFVDCNKIHDRVIYKIDKNFTTVNGKSLTLWIGQRNAKHVLFKVS